jgi:hypothetical protein
MSGEASYSQPRPSTYRNAGEHGVCYAGFVHGQPGFIVRRGRGQKDIREEATRENVAKQRPGGFLSSLVRLAFGGWK